MEVSGLLGFDILDGFAIDVNYRDGLVRLVYDQNLRYAQRNFQKSN